MSEIYDISKLIPALMKFQTVVPPLVKDRENVFLSEKNKTERGGRKVMYTDLASVIEKITTPLADNGLCITQLVNPETVTTLLLHESGQYLQSDTKIVMDKPTAQGMGSAITYARRYALCAILGIAAEDDDDGNGATGHTANTTASRSTNAPPKAENPAKLAPATPLMATEAQRKLFWQKAQAKGWSKQDLADSIATTYNVKSSAEMTMAQGKTFLEYLDTLPDFADQAGTDVSQK